MTWSQFERELRVYLGGKGTPGSGNKGVKGDVRLPGVCIEAKQTDKDSIYLQSDWFSKLEELYLKQNLEIVALALCVNNAVYVYYLDSNQKGKTNKSSTVGPEFPEVWYTGKYKWKGATLGEFWLYLHEYGILS